MELVYLCLDQVLLDRLDDVTLDLFPPYLEDLSHLLVASLLDASQHPRYRLDFHLSLQVSHHHPCALQYT